MEVLRLHRSRVPSHMTGAQSTIRGQRGHGDTGDSRGRPDGHAPATEPSTAVTSIEVSEPSSSPSVRAGNVGGGSRSAAKCP